VHKEKHVYSLLNPLPCGSQTLKGGEIIGPHSAAGLRPAEERGRAGVAFFMNSFLNMTKVCSGNGI